MNRRQAIKTALILFTDALLLLYSNSVSAWGKKGKALEQLFDGFNPFGPTNPYVTAPHSIKYTFEQNLKKYNSHAGISYDLPKDQPIVACAPGLVEKAKTRKETQEFISIQHGKHLFVVYYHNREGSRKVKAGDMVERGQPLVMPYTNSGTASKLQIHRIGYADTWDDLKKVPSVRPRK